MLSSGVGDCGLRIADCGFDSGEDGGLRIEDGAFGSVVAGSGDEKPIFKGVCAAGETCAGVAGDGFNFSGKFGSAEVSGTLVWWGEATDEPGNSGVVRFCFPSGSRGRSPHRLDSVEGSE